MERSTSSTSGSACTLLGEPPAPDKLPALDSVETGKPRVAETISVVEGLNEA